MNNNYFPSAKVDNLARVKKRKRVINPKECQHDMKDVLWHIFCAYHQAVKMYNQEIAMTPIEYRAHSFEASYFNSKLIQCLGGIFDTYLKSGKYGRRFLYKNGYIVLFKKLNGKSMPMNIRTRLSTSIENQLEGNLFNDEEDGCSPIIFFGYSKSKFGEICNPRIVYIDDGMVKWTINENMVHTAAAPSVNIITPQPAGGVTVRATAKRKRKAE